MKSVTWEMLPGSKELSITLQIVCTSGMKKKIACFVDGRKADNKDQINSPLSRVN